MFFYSCFDFSGPLKIEVLNKKGETMSRIPTAGKADLTKLSVKLKLVHHGEVTCVTNQTQFSKTL